METNLKKLKEEGLKIRMSDAEKSAMRFSIFKGGFSPARQRGVALDISPYAILFRRSFVPLLAVIILLGAGTASAAQGSIPGDILYTVKISVNEKIESALARGPSAKAAVYTRFAERRLEEAQQLAARGALDSRKEADLETRFAAHALLAQEFAQEADAEDPGTAAEVKIKLTASADARGKVLAQIGEDSKSDETKRHSRALSQKVLERAEEPDIKAAAFAAPAEQSARGSAEPEKAAAQLQAKASESLEEASGWYAEVKASLDAATVAQVDAELSSANGLMAAGGADIGAGSYAQAVLNFKEAFKIGVKLSVLLEAEKKFDRGIIKHILEKEKKSGETIRIELPR